MKHFNPIFLIFISLFLLIITKITLANEIYEGQYFNNVIKNAYDSRLNFYLPPGDWQVDTIEDSGNSDQKYKDITLWSDADEYMWLSIPITSTTPGFFWHGGGLKKCKGVKKKDIYTFAVKRGNIEAALCISKWTGDDDFEWADVVVNIRSTSGNLKWTTQNYSTDYSLLNQTLGERERKKIAESALVSLIKGFNGSDPSGASALLALFN